MTTPPLTAEPDWTAIDRLRVLSQRLTRVVHVQPSDLIAVLAALDQPAVARHVRETGCDGLREALRRHIVALAELCELVTRHEDATECGCGDFDDWFQAWDGPAQRLHVPDDVMAEAIAALASPATEEVERG